MKDKTVTLPDFEILESQDDMVVNFVRKYKRVARLNVQEELGLTLASASFTLNKLCSKGILKKSKHRVRIRNGVPRNMDVFELA